MIPPIEPKSFCERWFPCCCKKKPAKPAKIDNLVFVIVEGKIVVRHERMQSTEVISIKKALHETPREI